MIVRPYLLTGELSARLSGVKTQRMLFLTYVNMGFLASLAGLTYAVRANSAFPMAGHCARKANHSREQR